MYCDFFNVIYIFINKRGIVDLNRTNYVMDQLSMMMSPKKLNHLDMKKYLPTI